MGGLARLSTEVEAEGDDDVGNGASQPPPTPTLWRFAAMCGVMLTLRAVGLSRVQSREHNTANPRPRTAEMQMPPNDSLFGGLTTAQDHQPFSEHELTLALQRSHLAVPGQA